MLDAASLVPLCFVLGCLQRAASTLEAELTGDAGSLAASAARAGGLGGAAGVHGRAGDDVAGHLGVDVDEDTGVGGLVSTGEADGSGGGVAAAGDGELVAGHVWLSTARAAGGVEGDDLSTQEVVAGGDVGRDLDVDAAAALVEVLDTPEVVVAAPAGRVLGPAVLVDLEPPGRAVGGGGVADLGEVDHDGAVVVAADAVPAAVAVTRLLRNMSAGIVLDTDRPTW